MKKNIIYLMFMIFIISANVSLADDFKCGTKIVQQGLNIEDVVKFCPEIKFEKKHYETKRLPCTAEQITIRRRIAFEQNREYTEEDVRKCMHDQLVEYNLYAYKQRGHFIRYISVNDKGMIVTISTSSDKE